MSTQSFLIVRKKPFGPRVRAVEWQNETRQSHTCATFTSPGDIFTTQSNRSGIVATQREKSAQHVNWWHEPFCSRYGLDLSTAGKSICPCFSPFRDVPSHCSQALC